MKVAEAMEQMHPNSQLYCEIELVSKEGEGLPVVLLLVAIMVIALFWWGKWKRFEFSSLSSFSRKP